MNSKIDQACVEEALNRITQMAKLLRALAISLLAVCLIVSSLVVLHSFGAGPFAGEEAELPAGQLLPLLFMLASGVSVSFIAVLVLSNAAAGPSPFTDSQAKRFSTLGKVIAACACAAIACSVVAAVQGPSSASAAGLATWEGMGMIYVDVLLIAAAIVSFYFSYLFKYGSFLQWLYDETV